MLQEKKAKNIEMYIASNKIKCICILILKRLRTVDEYINRYIWISLSFVGNSYLL